MKCIISEFLEPIINMCLHVVVYVTHKLKFFGYLYLADLPFSLTNFYRIILFIDGFSGV